MKAAAVAIDASKKKAKTAEATFKATLDRLGYLEDLYRQAKPWIDEREKLKKAIQNSCPDLAADATARLEGDRYFVDLTARESKRTIKSKLKAFNALLAKMGKAALIEALTITLTLMEGHLSAEEVEALVTKEQTGPRTVTAVSKMPAAA